MKFERIVSLGRERAIEEVKKFRDTGHTTVMYRHGVWNSYEKTMIDSVLKSIENSGYGADVYISGDKTEMRVSIPCDSDMW